MEIKSDLLVNKVAIPNRMVANLIQFQCQQFDCKFTYATIFKIIAYLIGFKLVRLSYTILTTFSKIPN